MAVTVATGLSIERLWAQAGFTPNERQREAILHVDGPLYLPAGPGSGKTRVLLWRTLNLCVFHDVHPEDIYLSTFTEKAAFQLKEGLRTMLGMVTNSTGQPYDISKMYVGTVHSLCQRIIADRRFYPNRHRGNAPTLLDELSQYFYLYKQRMWSELLEAGDLGEQAHERITELFGRRSASKHHAVMNAIALFNRLSEERIDPDRALHVTADPTLQAMLKMYKRYVQSLGEDGRGERTDFSLLQQRALQVLDAFDGAPAVFRHVIIDEYQDTNTIQEQLFFRLAEGHKNICVVGDDDQALYRFRGATVENFVQFPERCISHLGVKPVTIPLARNYRSRQNIVSFYTDFMDQCDWNRYDLPGASYRVENKNIHPHSTDAGVAVVATSVAAPEDAAAQIARLVRELLDTKKVENPNQIAFLFPSLKYGGEMTAHVRRMREALEEVGLRVYAPRAGRFLEVDEATEIFGVFLHIFGKPHRSHYRGDYLAFHNWLDAAYAQAKGLLDGDVHFAQYVRDLRDELATAKADYLQLVQVASEHGWDMAQPYNIQTMKRRLLNAPGLAESTKRTLGSRYLDNLITNRSEQGRPVRLEYVIKRSTSIEWSLMDLFYRLCGFDHFKRMFDLAESGEDEGPICNLGLVSQYLGRFMDEYIPMVTADALVDDRLQRLLFSSYLFAIFRRSESEYEDADDPFPKGRIPFLTIHQSKGLEFPVVVLGNPRKDNHGPQAVETFVRPMVSRQDGEPLDRMSEFDTMRMFYVALSRAKNLLVLAHFKGPGIRINTPFKLMLDEHFTRIPDFDVSSIPAATLDRDDLARNYSYTGDFLQYQLCPRQYMVFRKYGFVASRSQTMMFGSLVHQTIDDLHQYLIAQRSQPWTVPQRTPEQPAAVMTSNQDSGSSLRQTLRRFGSKVTGH